MNLCFKDSTRRKSTQEVSWFYSQSSNNYKIASRTSYMPSKLKKWCNAFCSWNDSIKSFKTKWCKPQNKTSTWDTALPPTQPSTKAGTSVESRSSVITLLTPSPPHSQDQDFETEDEDRRQKKFNLFIIIIKVYL